MPDPFDKYAQFSHLKHQQFLREAAQAHLAAQAPRWGLRWHTAQALLVVAAWLSPKHRSLLQRGPYRAEGVGHS